MIRKKIKKLRLVLLILIVCVAFLCVKGYQSTRDYNAETMQTMKLEANIEAMFKKHPNKTTLALFHKNHMDIIYSEEEISDALKYDDPYPYPDAPSKAYWVIGIIAMGPLHYGKSYTVYLDKKGKFLTYQSYELVSPGLDF